MKNNKATETKKMYLTVSEAKAANLLSTDEQIARWNELQKQIRSERNAESMLLCLRNQVEANR